jgi:hypothetical protein
MVQIEKVGVSVKFDRWAHNPFIVATRLADQTIPMPRIGNRQWSINRPRAGPKTAAGLRGLKRDLCF